MNGGSASPETGFAFSAHPDAATAAGEVIGALRQIGMPATTVLVLFAGPWPTGERWLIWRTVTRLLQPELAAGGAVPDILSPRATLSASPGASRHRSLAVIASDNGPTEIVQPCGPAEVGPAGFDGPALILTGHQVAIAPVSGRSPLPPSSTGPTSNRRGGHRQLGPGTPGGRRPRPGPGFLATGGALHAEIPFGGDDDEPTRGPVVVRFHHAETAFHRFETRTQLGTGLAASVLGRELTALNDQPAAAVLRRLVNDLDRPGIVPHSLVIRPEGRSDGTGTGWRTVLSIEESGGSVLLDEAVPTGSTVSVALPDPAGAIAGVKRRMGPDQRALLAVSDHHLRLPTGFAWNIHDADIGLDSLVVPSPGMVPGTVDALVFGAGNRTLA